MTTARWTAGTTAGLLLGGAALHSPGASGVGAAYLQWDVAAALFGGFLGVVLGAITGLLQSIALGRRDLRVFMAMVVTICVAHALADGPLAVWGVSGMAAVSVAVAAVANVWRMHTWDARLFVVVLLAWWAGGWAASRSPARSV